MFSATEPDGSRALLRQECMSDGLAAEKSISQHLYGSHMAYRRVALSESVNQCSQCRDIVSIGSSRYEIAH